LNWEIKPDEEAKEWINRRKKKVGEGVCKNNELYGWKDAKFFSESVLTWRIGKERRNSEKRKVNIITKYKGYPYKYDWLIDLPVLKMAKTFI